MIYNILPHLTPIILYLIPYFNTSHTVCARCWRTGVCQMKNVWKPLKINLKMPDFWLKKPTENTMRWFCWFQLGWSAQLISADYCCNPSWDFMLLVFLSCVAYTNPCFIHIFSHIFYDIFFYLFWVFKAIIVFDFILASPFIVHCDMFCFI